MSKDQTPKTGPRAATDDRQARLGAALRANLRRRKAQSRAKSSIIGPAAAESADNSGDSGESPEVKEQ